MPLTVNLDGYVVKWMVMTSTVFGITIQLEWLCR
jgi:hypothetical protein